MSNRINIIFDSQNLTNRQILYLCRLNSKTIVDPITNCWLFTGARMFSGHGYITINYINFLTHRLSAHVFLGLNLNDQNIQANHKMICLNKNCWNPDHLYVGSQKDNIADSMNMGTHIGAINSSKTHCKAGHEFTEENTYIPNKSEYSRTKRFCKKCLKAKNAAYWQRKKNRKLEA